MFVAVTTVDDVAPSSPLMMSFPVPAIDLVSFPATTIDHVHRPGHHDQIIADPTIDVSHQPEDPINRVVRIFRQYPRERLCIVATRYPRWRVSVANTE